MLEYVVLAMPFAYRSLDSGLRSFDLRTLVDASRSLGGGWVGTLWRALHPAGDGVRRGVRGHDEPGAGAGDGIRRG
jgi:ABC-type Fe3+ transport system permease subunit